MNTNIFLPIITTLYMLRKAIQNWIFNALTKKEALYHLRVAILCIVRYRSHQYYVSKVLYKTKVTWILTFHRFVKLIILKHVFLECGAMFKALLLTPLVQRLVHYSSQNRSMNFLEKMIFGHFPSNLTKDFRQYRYSNVDCEVNNRPYLALIESTEVF